MKKKIVFLMCLCFMATSVCAYDECESAGGTEITAKNGTKFCKSKLPMNWWTAFNWCESNKGDLASFGKMCPDIPTAVNNATGACPNLQGTGDGGVWSSLGYSSNGSLVVVLSSGVVSYYSRHNSNSNFALCE